jgi:hypothetical protein
VTDAPPDELDAAWDRAPSSPAIPVLDPVEHLKRVFRGAIAANPSLWRSVDLEPATAKLEELARARKTSRSPISLDPVLAVLVRMHAPKKALQESVLAFAEEARQAGNAIALPRAFAAIDDDQKKALLKGFYARLQHGGDGARARQGALAGEVVIFGLPPRSQLLAKVLGAVVVVGSLTLLVDDNAADPGPRPTGLKAPASALPCQPLQSHDKVLRCTVTTEAMTAFAPIERRTRFDATRQFAHDHGYEDVLVINESGHPVAH